MSEHMYDRDPLINRVESVLRGLSWDAQDGSEDLNTLRQAVVNLGEILQEKLQRDYHK